VFDALRSNFCSKEIAWTYEPVWGYLATPFDFGSHHRSLIQEYSGRNKIQKHGVEYHKLINACFPETLAWSEVTINFSIQIKMPPRLQNATWQCDWFCVASVLNFKQIFEES
jgi:hypothetical protein